MAAKKKITKKKTTRKAQSKNVSIEDRLCKAALAVAAGEGWTGVSLGRLANDLKVPLGEVMAVCSTRSGLINLLFSRVENTVLRQVNHIDVSESPRDRLFDIVMMRFDALQVDRAGYVSLIKHLTRRPIALMCRAPMTVHAMAITLVAAGISAEGPLGAVRAHALAVAYGSVLQVWLKDESADMAQTMSALDKALGRLEKAAKLTAFKPVSKKKKTE